MNVIKIAWRSIQHRGFGSLLTVVSMALGVMMVVAVLSIHGLVSKSFKSNNSFGYNIIVGARGGGLQLTLNSVYYLSKPVENVPYEYYLAFCDKELRERDLKHSIAFQNRTNVEDTSDFTAAFSPFGGLASALSNAILDDHIASQQDNAMGLGKPGIYKKYTHMAVPICLGDYYVDPETEAAFRGVATSPNFFTDLVLDIETEEKFEFAKGRNFERESIENGFFECVVGSVVAKRCDIQVGDRLQATHGDPNDDDSHLHEQNFVVTGILKGTNTPNDRIVFFNMEGFFLIEDHVKPVESNSVLKSGNDDPDSDSKDDEKKSAMPIVDPFADEELDGEESVSDNKDPVKSTNDQNVVEKLGAAKSVDEIVEVNDQRIALPIEQREVTSILVRTSLDDEFDVLTMFLPPLINDGDIETTLDWTPFRPERAQKAAQAVNPVQEVASLFSVFVDPVRWLLLALTCMI
ncbi:MAG: ABC transporter permease [Planctomycetota bacterium]